MAHQPLSLHGAVEADLRLRLLGLTLGARPGVVRHQAGVDERLQHALAAVAAAVVKQVEVLDAGKVVPEDPLQEVGRLVPEQGAR